MFIGKNCLYLVLTEEYCNKPAVQAAAEAIDAGIDILQMREKNKPKEELLELGGKLKALCKGIPFIVNDDPYLAGELDADGVHLGQEDYEQYSNVRGIVGKKIIGLSTHSLEEVKEANELDVDYISFGPIFETKTKDYYAGTSNVEQVINITDKPVVFIGGINKDNIDSLKKLGAVNFAFIRAVTQSSDIAASVKKLNSKITDEVFITLNGKKEFVKSRTIPDLLTEKNFNLKTVIVEYNKEVANPNQWDSINLRNNDTVEIVSMFAGG